MLDLSMVSASESRARGWPRSRFLSCLALVLALPWILLGGPSGCAPGPSETPAAAASDADSGTSGDDSMATAIRLDAHAHLLSCDLYEGSSTCTADEQAETCETTDGLVTTADEYLGQYVAESDTVEGSGSELSQILSMAYQWSSPLSGVDSDYEASEEEIANVECQNNYTVQQTSQYPGQLLPFCSVNPKKSYVKSEIERCATELGVSGLKLHFSSSEVDVTDKDTRDWVIDTLRAAVAYDLPVVVHFGDLEILCGACDEGSELDEAGMVAAMEAMLTVVLPATPGLRLTFAHLTGVGAFPDWTQQTFEMLIEAYAEGNGALDKVDLYVDLAAVFNTESSVNGNVPGVTTSDLAVMGELLSRWGLERVFWGSDLDPDAFADIREMWAETGLSVADFNQIAGADGTAFRDGG